MNRPGRNWVEIYRAERMFCEFCPVILAATKSVISWKSPEKHGNSMKHTRRTRHPNIRRIVKTVIFDGSWK